MQLLSLTSRQSKMFRVIIVWWLWSNLMLFSTTQGNYRVSESCTFDTKSLLYFLNFTRIYCLWINITAALVCMLDLTVVDGKSFTVGIV